MKPITSKEAFFRIFAGLFLLYSLYQMNESWQAIEVFNISPEQKIWDAVWLHIFGHMGVAVSCLLVTLRVRWGLWLLVSLVVVTKAFGRITELDTGIVTFISVATVLFLVYAIIFLRSYLVPWKRMQHNKFKNVNVSEADSDAA